MSTSYQKMSRIVYVMWIYSIYGDLRNSYIQHHTIHKPDIYTLKHMTVNM